MEPLQTERLTLRPLDAGDAPFILALVNEPAFVRYIGDRGLRTVEDARAYLTDGPWANGRAEGFGSYLVAHRATGEALGLCSFLQRPHLDAPDLGFAFLPAHRGQGYAAEAARAVLGHARDGLGFNRVVAVTVAENAASIRLLEHLGFVYEQTRRLTPDDDEVRLYAWQA